MKVLLLADPPAGDKVQRELEALGAEVDYRRGVGDKQMIGAVNRPGIDWVVAMNAHSHGAAIKAAARANGARFVSIPPGWAGAEKVLRDAHFFTDLEIEKHNGATALTQRPFATIGDITVAKEAAAAAKAEVKKVSILAGPKPPDAPPAKPPAPPPPAAAAPPQGLPAPPAEEPLRPDEQEVVRAAEEAFARNPHTTLVAFVKALRTTGRYVSSRAGRAASAIRRKHRAAAGLKPTGAEGYSKTTHAAFLRTGSAAPPAPAFTREQAAALIPARPPPAPSPDPVEVGLPKGVVAALELAAQELRAAGLEGVVSITHEGEVDFDVAVRRRAAGKLRVGGVG